MGVFPKKKYVSAADSNTIAARYRTALAKRPFLLFGLPFMTIIVAGSFVLTPATAIRYERHDRKVRQMTKEEELGVGKTGRKVDIRDEYYVSGREDIAPPFLGNSQVLGTVPADEECVSLETRGKRPRRLGAEACETTAG